MKRPLACLLALALALPAARGEGVALRTVSNFAGTDSAAVAYLEILKDWETRTGNTVLDTSATSDEAWKAGVINDFQANNEPDLLFYFAKTSDSAGILRKVVPLSEIKAAYPGLSLPENEALREADGEIYAVPVRPYWEGLFCNASLFERYGLALPTDREKLETAIRVFRENGIVPIAASLSDIPHYLTDVAILACGKTADHQAHPRTVEELPESWVKGMELIRRLYALGAFPDNVNATTEAAASQLFRDQKAAMQVDGSWFANGLPPELWDAIVALPFPVYDEAADPTATLGGASQGFYITRKAWNNPMKRDAAVDLLAALTSAEAIRRLGFTFGGRLLESGEALMRNTYTPIGDTMDREARDYWYSQVPGLADGSLDARAVMEEVVRRGAYR